MPLKVDKPDLFEEVTSMGELEDVWTIERGPIVGNIENKKSNSINPAIEQTNCTMAFITDCVDSHKCESACVAMGASGYKWFHIGCCECVGKSCINYGISEPKCKKCPEESEQRLDNYGTQETIPRHDF